MNRFRLKKWLGWYIFKKTEPKVQFSATGRVPHRSGMHHCPQYIKQLLTGYSASIGNPNDMFNKDKKKDGAELDLNAGVLAPVKTFVPVTGQKPGV